MKKFLSLVLALVMTMSLVTISAGAEDFTDDASINYEEAVDVMSAVGVVGGYADGSFNPTAGLSRGAAAKIICNMILGPTTAAALSADTAPYKDVATDNTYAGYIAYCAQQGIISGYTDGTFRPYAPLTGYAFQKMLLGALGYDADVEGYNQPNWSIAVAKQALGIGLNAGLKTDFNGSKAVTREEACLFAFNTLKATMVEYDTTITIGDITIAGSKASDVANTAATETIANDNKMQFAEKYFSKLTKKVNVTDDFGRPALTWINNKTEIGTFVDYTTLAASYTAAVDGGEVYSDIGSAAAKFEDVTYYIDGVKQNAGVTAALVADLKKGDNDTFGASDNGALTEVYVDVEEETIDVVVINTYIAEVEADYHAKKETLAITVFQYGAGAPNKVYLDDVAGIEGYKDGDMILVNIADGVVVNVIDPDVVADTAISKFSTTGEYVVADEQYDYAAKIERFGNVLASYNQDELEDKTYNVYLDQYGYAIGIKLVTGTAKYLFLAGYDKAVSNLALKTAEAAVIFTDGTMAKVEIDYNETNKLLATADDLNVDGDANRNTWFKYTEEDGVYTLTAVANQVVVNYGTTGNAKTTINCENARVADASNTAWGNDDSTYICVDVADVDADKAGTTILKGISKVTGVYTGVQDVTLDLDADAPFAAIYALYDSEQYIDAAVVLGEPNDDASKGYAYALKGAANESFKDGYYYWDFDAAVAGIVDTLTVKTKYTNVIDTIASVIVDADDASTYAVKGLLKLTYDEDGYVVNAEVMNADADNDNIYTNLDWAESIDPDVFDIYQMDYTNRVGGYDLVCTGRTLYSDATDVGLTLVTGAPVIVVQVVEDEDGDLSKSIEEYSSIAAALNALENEGDDFNGVIAADLNDKGTAEWIVLSVGDVYEYVAKGTPAAPVVPTDVVVESVNVAQATIVVDKDGAINDTAKVQAAVNEALYENGLLATAWNTTGAPWTVTAKILSAGTVTTVTFTVVAE